MELRVSYYSLMHRNIRRKNIKNIPLIQVTLKYISGNAQEVWPSKYVWVLHFLAIFDFKLAAAIFRVEIRQLSLLQNIFYFFEFFEVPPLG